nr:fimbrial chaperone [Shewanella algae]
MFGVVVLSSQVNAAFTLNGTRFIYDESNKNISIKVSNESNLTFGGQVWVSNFERDDEGVYFIPSPSFFKVDGNQKQIIRIMKVNNGLPKDRESLFWINVQEVPPMPDVEGGSSSLAIAMNIQVKLIYRPDSIKKLRENAEQKVRIIKEGNNILLDNPTPFFFAVSGILFDGEYVNVTSCADGDDKKISRLAPFSKVCIYGVESLTKPKTVSIEAINDFGGKQLYEISMVM